MKPERSLVTLGLVSTLSLLLWLQGCSTLADRWSMEGGQPSPVNAFRSTTGARSENRTEKWWAAFEDPVLNSLILHLRENNPDLAAAAARLDKSYAVLGQSQASQWPTLLGDGSFRKRQDSSNNLLFPTSQREYDQYRLGASASWEIDLWGRIRGAAKRDRLNAEAEAERFLDARLSLEANLARQYLAWIAAQHELSILEEAIDVRQEDLALQQARLQLGSGVEVDVSRSKVALSTAQAAAEAVRRSIGKLEHAIAIFLNVAPSEWQPPTQPNKDFRPPNIPAGVPSDLLVQRPDLRVAEKTLLAAAKEVGIRRVNFLPRISLTGSGGVASLKSSNLFKPESTLFDIGPEINVPLFQAGTRRQAVAEAKASWQEAVANYRSTYLKAVVEVDDALLDTKSLAKERAIQEEAVQAATETSAIARLRHERGLASYFEVVDAERDRLTSKRAENTLRAEQMNAAVRLIQALGGTW